MSVHDEVRHRAVVRPEEREALPAVDGLADELGDHAAVDHDDDPLIGMGGDDALEPGPHSGAQGLVRLGAGDHVPSLLGQHLDGEGMALGHVAAEAPALPLAEVDLPQVGLDDRRTLVITGNRAYIANAKPGLAAAAAAGSVALVNGNSLAARGSVPAVELQLGAEVMFSSNRCELAGSGRVPGVAILAPLLVFSSNRIACPGDVGATLTAGAATVLGNATSSPIRLNNAPLAAPWNALNITG